MSKTVVKEEIAEYIVNGIFVTLCIVIVLYQARRKQLQIGGEGAHIKSNYRLGGGGAHIIFF